MAYKIKNGKLEKSGTRVTRLDYVSTGYQETDEEKAARMGDVVQLERRVYDGVVKYCVPGLEPDTAATLVAAGLIQDGPGENDGEQITTILEPHNPRVLAWQAGVNEYGRSEGIDTIFPGAPVAMQMPKAGHA